jgi:hypothetical protein
LLRGDPERRFVTPSLKTRLGAAKRVKEVGDLLAPTKSEDRVPLNVDDLRLRESNDKGEAASIHPKTRQGYSRSPRPVCYASCLFFFLVPILNGCTGCPVKTLYMTPEPNGIPQANKQTPVTIDIPNR